MTDDDEWDRINGDREIVGKKTRCLWLWLVLRRARPKSGLGDPRASALVHSDATGNLGQLGED